MDVDAVLSLELKALVLAGLLAIGLAGLTILVHNVSLGGEALRGNRDGAPAPTGLLGRVNRAHTNIIASLVPFAIALSAQLTLKGPSATDGQIALIYVAARLAHAGLYVGGVPVLRSLAFYVGEGATLVLALSVLRIGL